MKHINDVNVFGNGVIEDGSDLGYGEDGAIK